MVSIKRTRPYIKLLRPKHWIKNVLIFIPLLYAGNLTQPALLWNAVRCYAAFCLLSSSVYIINDIADVEKDRQHPVKCYRPIAAGLVGVRRATVIAVFASLFGLALSMTGYGDYYVLSCAVIYVLLNLAYSIFLKHRTIIDCFCIAAGFILRVYAGGAAGMSPISEWLFLTIVAMSLFMAFGKRRGEMLQTSAESAGVTRIALAEYSAGFVDGMVFVCAGLSIVFYALWTMAGTDYMTYTVPLVIYIVCKYLLNIHNNPSSGDPVPTILGDKGLLVAVGLFAAISVLLLYA